LIDVVKQRNARFGAGRGGDPPQHDGREQHHQSHHDIPDKGCRVLAHEKDRTFTGTQQSGVLDHLRISQVMAGGQYQPWHHPGPFPPRSHARGARRLTGRRLSGWSLGSGTVSSWRRSDWLPWDQAISLVALIGLGYVWHPARPPPAPPGRPLTA